MRVITTLMLATLVLVATACQESGNAPLDGQGQQSTDQKKREVQPIFTELPPDIEASIIKREDARDPDSTFFRLLLESKEPIVRARGAVALGRIAFLNVEDPFTPALIGLLENDGNPGVRGAAAFALGETEDAAAVEALVSALDDADQSVRIYAAEALTKIGDDRAVELLAGKLEAEDTPLLVKRMILLTSFRFNSPYTATLAANIARGGPEELRWPALMHLTRNARGAASVLPDDELIRGLQGDDNPLVRGAAALLIGLSGSPTELLATFLRDEEPSVQIKALQSIGRLNAGELLTDVAGFIDSDNPHLRLTAVQTLTALTAGLADEAVADILERTTALVENAEPAIAAATITLHVPHGAASPLSDQLEALLTDEQPLVRAAALPMAMQLQREDLQQVFRRALEDDGYGVANNAVQLLGRIDQPWATAMLLETLQGDDGVLVTISAGVLANMESAEALEPILAALDTFSSGSANTEAYMGLLNTLVGVAPEDERVTAALQTALGSASRSVRVTAARLLTGLTGESHWDAVGPAETGRELSDYKDILEAMATIRGVRVKTTKGSYTMEFLPGATLTAWNIVSLARRGYFDGVVIHRVVPNFVAQMGCPRGDGWGGPGYDIRCEINFNRYNRWAVGMALAGKDTGGSQWFVTYEPTPHLDGGYTVFADVVEGFEVISSLLPGDAIIHVDVLEK